MTVKIFTLKFNVNTESFDDSQVQSFLADRILVSKSEYMFEANDQKYLTIILHCREALDGADQTNKTPPPHRNPVSGGPKKAPPTSSSSPKSNGSQKSAPANKAAYEPNDLTPVQKTRYGKMRQWRYQKANENMIPAYMICSNKELEQIVKKMPTTLDQLFKTQGVDERKMQKHGIAILSALRDCSVSLSQMG